MKFLKNDYMVYAFLIPLLIVIAFRVLKKEPLGPDDLLPLLFIESLVVFPLYKINKMKTKKKIVKTQKKN